VNQWLNVASLPSLLYHNNNIQQDSGITPSTAWDSEIATWHGTAKRSHKFALFFFTDYATMMMIMITMMTMPVPIMMLMMFAYGALHYGTEVKPLIYINIYYYT